VTVALSPAEALIQLERWGRARDWVGPDPYEGLNAPLGRLASSRRSRQAVIQLHKRLPVSPPWPLRAHAQPNAKALALALSGYASSAGRRLPGADRYLDELPIRLRGLNLLAEGAAWGYHFDAQTRHLFYDRDTPNAIATCFVVKALLDAHDATGRGEHAELAVAARPFLLSLLAESPRGPFFAYVATGSELIHNANLMVCGTLARLEAIDPDAKAGAAIRAATQTTTSCQRADGTWAYGEAPNLGWADNFHTAYLLEGLVHVDGAFGVGAEALATGLAAWRGRFFEDDGWARYYPGRRYPLEPHSCASAIDCLLAAGDNTSLAARVANVAIRELWMDPPGCFAFRRTARRLNRRVFMRWTNAPMFRALAWMEDERMAFGASRSESHQ
jgi:hypothetical protein